MARPRKNPDVRLNIKRFRDYKELGLDGKYHVYVRGKQLSRSYKAYLKNRSNWEAKGYSMRDAMTKTEFQEAYINAKRTKLIEKEVMKRDKSGELVPTGEIKLVKATANFAREVAKFDRRMTKDRARRIFKKVKEFFEKNPDKLKNSTTIIEDQEEIYDDYDYDGDYGGGFTYSSSSPYDDSDFAPEESESYQEEQEMTMDLLNITNWKDIFNTPNAQATIRTLVDNGILTSEEVHALY